jgi:[ribosomal protein S18]-alanine N-acetyltransferase
MERVMVVREFEESDVAAVAALEAASQPRPWSEGVFRDELRAPARVYLVADDQGIVGFGGAMLVGDDCHITNLLVDPERRGQGIGRTLLTSLIEKAIEAGARHLTLEVRVGNEAARSLYASLGLAPVGVRPAYYGNEDALILWSDNIDNPEFMDRLRSIASSRGTGYGVRGSSPRSTRA